MYNIDRTHLAIPKSASVSNWVQCYTKEFSDAQVKHEFEFGKFKGSVHTMHRDGSSYHGRSYGSNYCNDFG